MDIKERVLITKLAIPTWQPEQQELKDVLVEIESNLKRDLWDIKQKDNLVLIGSSQRDASNTPWEEYSIAFHNIIVDIDKLLDWVATGDNTNEVIVSRGFPKFFNWFEENEVKKFHNDPDYKPVAQALVTKQGTWVEKIDGSCLLINNINGKLNCRTRKSFSVEEKLREENPQQVAELEKLKELTPIMFDIEKNKFLQTPGSYTIICEWTTPNRRILVDYGNNPKLYLIGIVNNVTGELLNQEALNALADAWGVLRPAIYSTPQSEEDVTAFLDNKGIEGAVVYYDNDMMLKVKTSEYLQMVKFSNYRLNVKTLYKMWKGQYDKVFKREDISIEDKLAKCQISADNMEILLRENEELNYILNNAWKIGVSKEDAEVALQNWQQHITNNFYNYLGYIINTWIPKYVLSKFESEDKVADKTKFLSEIVIPFLNNSTDDPDTLSYKFLQDCITTLFQIDGPNYKKLLVEEIHKDFIGDDTTPPYRGKYNLMKYTLLTLVSKITPLMGDEEPNTTNSDEDRVSYVCLAYILPTFIRNIVEAYSGEDEELLNQCIDAELEFEITSQAPAVIIMRGVSGSGKSTTTRNALIKYLCKLYRGIHRVAVVSADTFFTDEDGNYTFDASKLSLAHQACQEDCQTLMTDPANKATFIIIDNTNMKLEHFSEYLTMAEQNGYIAILYTPPDMQKLLSYYNVEDREWYKQEGAQALIEEFARRNVHKVTKEIIENQCSNWESY